MRTRDIVPFCSLLSTVACAPPTLATAPAPPPPPRSTTTSAADGDAARTPRAVRRVHVETHPSQGRQRFIEGAKATLAVTDEGAMATLATKGLTPGHVYTLWFVAINAPQRCASSPCKAPDVLGNTEAVQADVRWADGAVASSEGTIELTGWAPAGAWSSGWFGRGYTNLAGSEIHLVVNDHGPVIAGRESAMLSSYREGCTDESLPPPFPATAKSDGRPGPNRCALVQDAIFTPVN